MWYDTVNNIYKQYATTSTGYGWEEMLVNPPSAVFDKIDGKCTLYPTKPVPPYHVRDLWVNATYNQDGYDYNNDILI